MVSTNEDPDNGVQDPVAPPDAAGDAPAHPISSPASYARKRRPGQRIKPEERDRLMPEVLRVLSIAGTLAEACRQTGLDRATVRDWRQKFPAFDAAYRDAEEDALDVFIGAATERAVIGIERRRPIYHQGELVGEEIWKEYSDRLLAQQLSARDPARFHTQRHEISGPDRGAIEAEFKRVNDDSPEHLALIAGILRDAGALGPIGDREGADAEDDEVHPDEEA